MSVRVLVVDESRGVRERLVVRLRDAGLEVVGEAATGAEAIAWVIAAAPDAIVIDVLLPDRRGLDVLPALRAAAPRAVIVVLTNAPEYRRHCLDRGADAFLDKSREFERVAGELARRAAWAAIAAHPDNATVIALLDLRAPASLETGGEASPFDEGARIFHRYAAGVPRSARWAASIHQLLVHEESARVFAFHRGRLTIALRAELEPDRDELRTGETLDGPVDLRALGPGWMLFRDDDEDAEARFARAYQRAGR